MPALLLTVVGALLWWPGGDGAPVMQTTPEGASYQRVTVESVDPDADPATGASVVARLDDGTPALVQAPAEYLDEISPGDRLRVLYLPQVAGVTSPYVFVDFDRAPPLLLLTVVFAALVLLVARVRGLAALLGLGLAVAFIGVFTLPALLEGASPVGVALVTASASMFALLYLAHGFSARTSTALVGTLVGLAATTTIAVWASGAAHLTGLGTENGLDLRQLAPDASLRGILLCGMVIAGLGVLNDVTITQASAVWELRAASAATSRREVFRQGMRIGRDHIASTVYTVAFAYLGASLPLVLLVSMSDRGLLSSLTSGEIAEEVVRTLVGSIGLVLAIPVTTAVAALVVPPPAPAAPDVPAAPAPADVDGPGSGPRTQ